MTYAKDGHAFFSIETPSFFREVELPIDEADCSVPQNKLHQSLERDAEKHGTYVQSCSYKRG